MADVQIQRSLIDMLARLLDNSNNIVTPERIRDLLETVRPHYISITLPDAISPQTVTIIDPNVYVDMVLNLAITAESSNLDLVDTTIKWNGPVPIVIQSTLTLSVTVLGNNQVIRFAPRYNGTIVELDTQPIEVKHTGEIETFSFPFSGVLQPGDEVGISVKNETSDLDITLLKFSANHITLPYEEPEE